MHIKVNKVNYIDRALSIISADGNDWASDAIMRSLQSGAIYSMVMSSAQYLERLQQIHAIEDENPEQDMKNHFDDALHKYEASIIPRAKIYNWCSYKLPEAKNIDIETAIRDIAANTRFGVSQTAQTKERSHINQTALEIAKEELDVDEKTVKALIETAELEDRERQEYMRTIIRDNLRDVTLLVKESVHIFLDTEIPPLTELAMLERIASKLDEYINRKLVDSLRARTSYRAAQSLSDFKLLKKSLQTIDDIVDECRREAEAEPSTTEPADFAPMERIQRFENKLGWVVTQHSRSVEDELIAEEENEDS